ncbi:MAG TPA: hypothetical protein VIU45_05510 [Chitinophagaceae bacterium]
MDKKEMNRKEKNTRFSIGGGLFIIVGLLLGLFVKNIEIGLLAGLILGVVGGGLLTKRD